jgi:hypothetical protein
MVTGCGSRVFREATPVSDYYSDGEKVQATRDTGGFFGSETTKGQSGTVLGSSMSGGHFNVRWDDGHVSEVSADELKRWSS